MCVLIFVLCEILLIVCATILGKIPANQKNLAEFWKNIEIQQKFINAFKIWPKFSKIEHWILRKPNLNIRTKIEYQNQN